MSEMLIVKRSEIKDKFFKDMLKTEKHHNHEIVNDNGVYRWKQNDSVVHFMKNISLNDLIPLFECMGYGRNSEVYRKLFRDIGYSLGGYHEVFYWEMNNEDCDKYVPPEINRNRGSK